MISVCKIWGISGGVACVGALYGFHRAFDRWLKTHAWERRRIRWDDVNQRSSGVVGRRGPTCILSWAKRVLKCKNI